MTVKELIQKLSLYEDDLEVFSYYWDEYGVGNVYGIPDPAYETVIEEDSPTDKPFVII